MLLAAPDLVLALDVDKILAGDARILERLYIVGDVHRSEHVVGAVDKPGEMLARPCGQAVVVDEDVVAHTHLGDNNLGMRPDMSLGVLKVEPDHLVLLLGKQQLHDVDGVLHPDRVIVYTTERSVNLLWVSTMARMVNCCSSSAAARSAIGAAQDTL